MQSQSITLETIQPNKDASIKRFVKFFAIVLIIIYILIFIIDTFQLNEDSIIPAAIPILFCVVIVYIVNETNTRDAIRTGTLTIGQEKIMYWPNGNNAIYYYWNEIKAIQYFYHSYENKYMTEPKISTGIPQYYSNGDKNYIVIQKKNGRNIRINFHLDKKQYTSIETILKQNCHNYGIRFYKRNRV